MREKMIYFIMAALLVLAGGCGRQETDSFLQREADSVLQQETDSLLQQEVQEESGELSDAASEKAQDPKEKQIYVQVGGAVAEPGVYALAEGSRVFQAVELAGGVLEGADAGKMNQAELLCDGQMIYIPFLGEDSKGGSEEEKQEDGRINLNTATEAELMALPGIGAAKAGSIISWREANGGFSQVEDLMKVEGIKDGVFSKIKDSVRVD